MKLKRFNTGLNERWTLTTSQTEADVLIDATKFLKYVAADVQFDQNSEYYHGFLNISLSSFESIKQTTFKNRIKHVELIKQFKAFLQLYNTDMNLCNQLMHHLGLDVEDRPNLEECIFMLY